MPVGFDPMHITQSGGARGSQHDADKVFRFSVHSFAPRLLSDFWFTYSVVHARGVSSETHTSGPRRSRHSFGHAQLGKTK